MMGGFDVQPVLTRQEFRGKVGVNGKSRLTIKIIKECE